MVCWVIRYFTSCVERAHNRGNILFQKEDFKGAHETYGAVLTVDPRNIHGWVGLGKVMGTVGRFSEAITCFQRALALDPLNKKASEFLKRTQELMKSTNP